MPVELNIIESVTELDTTVVTVVLESASEPGPAGPGVPAGGTTDQVLAKASDTDYDTEWVTGGGGGGGAPTDATYLVTTANGDLSAEVVVGATPGGELGGTWASPTVDATHSGSSHAAVQAAAEATAAAALSAHTGDTTDAHDASAISVDSTTLVGTGTDVQAVLEELDNGIADHLADATDAHAGTAITNTPAGGIAATTVQAAINELDTEKAAASHAHAGEDITSGTVADARIASTIARDSEVTSAIATHEADTTSVHGIADTSALALTANHPSNATFNDHSARHEDGGADEITIAGLAGIPTELQAHLDDTSDAHDASAISVLDSGGDYTATDAEGVLAEIASRLPWDGAAVRVSDKDVASNTALANDGVLEFVVVANEVYEFELTVVYSSPAGGGTPDLKCDFNQSTGSLTTSQKLISGVATNDVAQFAFSFDISADLTFGTATAKRVFTIQGIVGVDAAATVAFRWAQNTSGVNATRVHAGSSLRYRRLG